MKISIGNDHAGTEHKKEIIKTLQKKGHVLINNGTDSSESVDYPDHIHPVAVQVSNKKIRHRYYYLWKWKRSQHDSKQTQKHKVCALLEH